MKSFRSWRIQIPRTPLGEAKTPRLRSSLPHAPVDAPRIHYEEVEAFKRLKRQLAAYRVVFGQPRQEELVVLLERADFSVNQLRELTIDLSPPDSKVNYSTRPDRN